MRLRNVVRPAWVLCVALGAIALAGCDKEAKWEGVYVNTKDQSTLELKPEHKAALKMAGVAGDVTWEIAGDDKITVHAGIPIEMFKTSEGLRDQEGTAWKKK